MRRLGAAIFLTALLGCLLGCTDQLDLQPMHAEDGGPGLDAERAPDVGVPFNPHNPAPDANTVGEPDAAEPATPLNDAIECQLPRAQPWQPVAQCTSPIRWQHTITNGEPKRFQELVAADANGNIYWMLTMFGLVRLGGREIGDPFTPSVLLVSYAPDGALRWVFDIYDAEGAAFALSEAQVCIGASSASDGITLQSKLDPDVTGFETIACLALDGELRWSRDVDSLLTRLASMTFDGQGNLYVGGHFQGNLTVSSAHSEAARDITEPGPKGDGFVVSYTADGEVRWLTTMGGPRNDGVSFIAGLADGRVVVVGERAESFEIGAGPTPDLGLSGSMGGAAFVALLDQAGLLEWAVRAPDDPFIGDGTLRPNALLIDTEDRIVVAYEYENRAVAYDQLGAVSDQYMGLATFHVSAISAHRTGFVTFERSPSEEAEAGTLRTTDLDFTPHSTRLLVERSIENEGALGASAVAVAPDDSIIVVSEWGTGLYHRIVVLEP